MAAKQSTCPSLSFHPLTAERWPDLEKLFGARGACGGCWCMWWRLTRSEFEKNKGAANKRAFKKIVWKAGDDAAPGILACTGDEPIGWCAVGPRETYPVLGRSPVLKPVDDRPVWSITCLFIARPYRRRGISGRLINAAVEFARHRGAKIVEGYPVEPRGETAPDAFVWTGLPSSYRNAGFREVLRRSPTRPILRRTVRRSPVR